MRILVHEFASGGGLVGRVVPASLAREGRAMLGALITDLDAIGSHEIVTTGDPRFPLAVPPGVTLVPMGSEHAGSGPLLDRLMASVDAAWFVAPETGGALERLVARAERCGTPVIGSDSRTIRRVSDKGSLGRCLARSGISYPVTDEFGPDTPLARWKARAVEIGYPVVVKPRRGAGCEGVSQVRGVSELAGAVDRARQVAGQGPVLLQAFVPGVAASVSLVCDGRRAMPLSLNSQIMCGAPLLEYLGGTTPFDHPLSERARATARAAVESLSGLRGYVGVDLVLTGAEAVVIEVNPRLTTAYLGVRATGIDNIAAMVLTACDGVGRLPSSVGLRQQVRFTSGGEIVSAHTMGLGA